MNVINSKTIGSDTIRLIYDTMYGVWYIEDVVSGDCNSYDTKQSALDDFRRINDIDTLYDVFGWK